MKSTLTFVAVAVLSLTACTRSGTEAAPRSDTFSFRLPSEPPTVFPVRGIDNISIDVMNNILEGLFEFDAAMKPQPMLAERYTLTPDGKTYHFWLRKNVLWSDGVSFGAQQVLDSWEMILNSKSQAEYAYFLFPIVNAENYHIGKVKDFSQVGVKRINEFEFTVTLRAPLAYFTDLLAVAVTFPMRVDLYKQYGDKWTEPPHVASLAPYVLTKWNHDREMIFESNPNYWGERPKVKRVVAQIIPDVTTALNLFESGRLDLVRRLASVDIPRFSRDPRFFTTSYFRDFYLAFQMKDPLVQDVNVRRALALALDRDAMIKVLKGGQVATSSFIPEGMLGYASDVGLRSDPAQAKKLWAARAGTEKSRSTRFQLYYDQRDDNKLVMEIAQQQWRTVLGLEVELIPIEWKVYLNRMREGLGPIFRYGWGADFPDPDNFMTVFLSGGGNNLAGWKNKNYDALVLEAQHERKSEKRVALYTQAQKILLEQDVVIVPLFTESLNFVLQPQWQKINFDRMSNLFFKRIQPAVVR